MRQIQTIDSLEQRLQIAQARIQALSNHLDELGFPIGRADSAGQDSAWLPAVFFVRQPARTVRQGQKLIATPAYYLCYRRSPKTDEATAVPGIAGTSFDKQTMPPRKRLRRNQLL